MSSTPRSILGSIPGFVLGSFLATACGSVADNGPDARVVDADTSGNATVATRGALFGQPPATNIADIELISNLSNLEILSTGKSDAGGAAAIKVYPGGSLTAAYKHTQDLGYDFITFVGVKPEDSLVFGNREPAFVGTNTAIGSMTYSWPALAGAQAYYVMGGCLGLGVGSASTSAIGTEFPSCHHEPMGIAFVAVNPSGQLINCANRQTAFVNGGSLSIGAWGTAANATANIAGLPADFTNLTARFAAVFDGQSERGIPGAGNANGAPSGGAFTGTFPWCPFGERTAATLFLNRPGFQGMRVHDVLPTNATSWTVASPQLPPSMEGGILTSAAKRRAEWTLVPGASDAHDAVTITFVWSVTIAGTSHTSRWSFVLPPNTTEVTMPKLPPSFEPILPKPEFGLGINFLRAVEIPTVPSYDAYRALGAATALCPECAVRAGDVQRVILSGF
jgi:hypothetical protein